MRLNAVVWTKRGGESRCHQLLIGVSAVGGHDRDREAWHWRCDGH